MKVRLDGLIPATVLPMKVDGAIDELPLADASVDAAARQHGAAPR